MTDYSLLFKPKKKALASGAVPLAIAITAKTQKLAVMQATMLLEDEMPGASDNFFSPDIIEDKIGSPRPPIGRFDEIFAKEYNLVDGAWQQINPPVDEGHTEIDLEASVDFNSLPLREKITIIVLIGKSEIKQRDLSMAVDFLNDDESSAALMPAIDGMSSVPALNAMYPEALIKLNDAVFSAFAAPLDAEKIQKFAEKWVAQPRDRDALAGKKPAPQNTVTKITPVPQNTDTQITPLVIRGPFKDRPFQHNFDTLDLEIAVALKFDVDCWDVGPRQVAEARRLIELDDKNFKLWSMEFRLIGKSALEIPREAVFEIVRAGKKFLPSSPPAAVLRDFLHQQIASIEMPEALDEKPAPASDTTKTGEQAPEPAAVATKPADTATKPADQPPAAVLSIPETLATSEQPAAQPSIEVEKQEVPAADIKLRTLELENAIDRMPASAQENLTLWRQVHKTDGTFTKAFTNDGGGTSINGTYMVMRATEVFRPQGINWGIEILEERFDEGAPIYQNIPDAAGKLVRSPIVGRNGDFLMEPNHIVKIRLRYELDGREGKIIAYGCTPYRYNSKYGPISDGEAPKKSLTDATKKALSQLGFSADIFLGLYDNPQYREEIGQEFAIKNASDKAEDVARLRKELDEKLSRNAETLQTGVSPNEINAVFSTIAREVEVHRKAAEAKGDQEYAKYLSGRLRRLATIKDERLANLAAGATA
jgi:hypothetical protein